MSPLLQIQRSELGRLEPLGKGGTALVYRAPDLRLPGFPRQGFAYKEYSEKTRLAAGAPLGPGLSNFVRFREKLPERQQQLWDSRIVWPIRVVVDETNAATGIIMPIIPDRFFHDFIRRSGPSKRKPREVDTLFGDLPTMRRIGLPEISDLTRLRLVLGIAGAYGMMHREGVVLGDISARNVIYDPDPANTAVLIVDVDSARVAGTRSVFSSQPHTPNWQPPEALDADKTLLAAKLGHRTLNSQQTDRVRNIWAIQSVRTDVYKFGLMVVRILDYGRGKAVNRNPSQARQILRKNAGSEAAILLDRSLDRDPKARPTMREWYDALHQSKPGKATRLSSGRPTLETVETSAARIPEGRRIGDWVWHEGKGWERVRSS